MVEEEEAVFLTAGAALPLATTLLFLAAVAAVATVFFPTTVFPLVPFLLVDTTAAALGTAIFFMVGLAVASLLFLAAAPVEAGAFRLLLRTAAPVFVTADLAAGMGNSRMEWLFVGEICVASCEGRLDVSSGRGECGIGMCGG